MKKKQIFKIDFNITKGAIEEVKRPKGTPLRSRGPESPKISSYKYFDIAQVPGVFQPCCTVPRAKTAAGPHEHAVFHKNPPGDPSPWK